MEPCIELTLPHSGLAKVLEGRKTIISCWSDEQPAYWGRVRRAHRLHLRSRTKPAAARAIVSEVLEFNDLTTAQVHDILDFYGHDDGIDETELDLYKNHLARKKYCTLIFLESIESSMPVEAPMPNKRFGGSLSSLHLA